MRKSDLEMIKVAIEILSNVCDGRKCEDCPLYATGTHTKWCLLDKPPASLNANEIIEALENVKL